MSKLDFDQAVLQNFMAESFAVDAYRQIAAARKHHDKASLRLAKVALTVEKERAEILWMLIEKCKAH